MDAHPVKLAPLPVPRGTKKTPAASSGRESQSRRCHTNYGFRLSGLPAAGNEAIPISLSRAAR
ncbi:hypothetical protein [Burkholderia ubonensis]|uniref:hypothetical protein n=1 Tax=Burkholderia ubonensis TaxID=101571 RepID=UPI0012F71178|nr:hypothetical protein [Burkholderia ubonensis]